MNALLRSAQAVGGVCTRKQNDKAARREKNTYLCTTPRCSWASLGLALQDIRVWPQGFPREIPNSIERSLAACPMNCVWPFFVASSFTNVTWAVRTRGHLPPTLHLGMALAMGLLVSMSIFLAS